MKCVNCSKEINTNLINFHKGFYCSFECKKIDIDKRRRKIYSKIVDEKLNKGVKQM